MIRKNLEQVKASQVAQWEKMKQSRTTIKILIEEFIQMFPNKIPPVDKLFNEINLGKYIQQRIQQTPKINIGNYTQHTEIVKNKAPYLRPQVFDNVWYTDEAGITQHYRVTELNKSTKRATLRYHMDSTFTVDVKDIRVVDEDEAYKGFYGAGADVCRETAESMRTKLLAANKTAQPLTPSSHSSNSHPSRAHALNAVAARPLNSRLHCVTLSIELAYSFKRYVDKCPLQDLESRDSHFINAMCAKWRSFTEQHKTGDYGLFFQFVGIINTAQLTGATVVDTLRELEGMIDGHVDHEELRHRIVGDIQTRGEPIKSYVSRKCVNKSLLGKLYTSKKAMFLGIAKGIESQAVKTKVLEWLALEEESNLTEGYVTQGFAKIHKQYHMFQSSNSLIESEWKPKTGVRAVTAATNNSTKHEKQSALKVHFEAPAQQAPPPPLPPRPQSHMHAAFGEGQELEMDEDEFMSAIMSENPPWNRLMRIKHGIPKTYDGERMEAENKIYQLVKSVEDNADVARRINQMPSHMGQHINKYIAEGVAINNKGQRRTRKPTGGAKNLRNSNFTANSRRHLGPWLTKLKDLNKKNDIHGRLDHITKSNADLAPYRPDIYFLCEGEPLSQEYPYWYQIPTILTNPEVSMEEPFRPPPVEYLKTLEQRKIPDCLRCGGWLHPWDLCVTKNPKYCGRCGIGGHDQFRCEVEDEKTIQEWKKGKLQGTGYVAQITSPSVPEQCETHQSSIAQAHSHKETVAPPPNF